MHCYHIRSLMGIAYSSRKPDFVFIPWQKWRKWVLGHFFTAKRTPGEAMKHLEALVLVIDMTNNALLPCQDTHGNCLLFPKTQLCLHPMAKRVKLGFWSSLALYHSQKDHWRGHETFWGLSACDRHDKQCTTSMSRHLWGLLAPPWKPDFVFIPWQKWQKWVLG